MNFVITNVTTVEEDDEEPLYEIKKVSVFKETKEFRSHFIDSKSRVRNPSYKKSCYVPLCPNSSTATPDKMFITVPVNPLRRKEWLDVVGKTSIGKNPKSPMFCCEDHFNLEKDMKNYDEHVSLGKVQMVLHPTVKPHIFICNQYGHLKRKERLEILKRLEKEKHSDPLAQVDVDKDCEMIITQGIGSKRPSPQRTKFTPKRRKLDIAEKQPNKPVFIEMPTFQYDKPDYVQIIQEDAIDTIVIDDSDSEEC